MCQPDENDPTHVTRPMTVDSVDMSVGSSDVHTSPDRSVPSNNRNTLFHDRNDDSIAGSQETNAEREEQLPRHDRVTHDTERESQLPGDEQRQSKRKQWRK